MSKNLIIIPTYNEKENIEAIIRAVFSEDDSYHILVVDDSSPDGTATIVKRLQKEFSNLFIEEREGKKGLGTAYIHGFKWALQHNYDFVVEMDADFSHPIDKIKELLHTCTTKNADVCVGSRYVKGGRIRDWDTKRIILSYFASLYVRIILGIPVKDTTAGFVCYSSKVLKSIDLNNIKFVGYAFQIEMKYKAYKKGFRIKEIPINFVDRKIGTSKMNGSIIKEAVIGVFQMRFNYKP